MSPFRMMICRWILVLSLVGVIVPTLSHVSLTYPPARKYQLDFLDTFRTVKPCGMNKGDIKTTIPNGQKLKVQWHLGYPHEGSIKLLLLDANGALKKELTQPVDGYPTISKTAQEYEVDLPSDLTCSGCTIRLLRQALEWGKNYQFQSCADVDIVNKADYSVVCSGQGTLNGPNCTCNKMYHGHLCQYKNECDNDDDCGGSSSGKCVSLGGSALPAKQCYCINGKMGTNCDKKSKFTETQFDPKDYTETSFGATTKFYWKMDGEDHFEGIMKAKTDSYLAVGWRDLYADKSCRDEFPKDAPKMFSSASLHPMDCLDIVMGSVQEGKYSRIGDYYTRDRSTPRLDKEFWGEKSDLTDVVGWETDGITYIRFRRPISGTGGSDRDFYGNLHLAWAHGQDSKKNPFYTSDEIKYHGPNKGYARILVGPEPLDPKLKATIAAIVLLVIVFLFQCVHNCARIKKVET